MITLLCACDTPGVEIPGLSGTRVSDQEQIAAVLDDVHRGMESRRIYKVLAHVSQGYNDLAGRDREGIEAYLADFFNRYREIRITRARPRIQVQGDRAQALETFGTRAEAVNDGDINIHVQGEVVVSLRRESGEWRITEWGEMR